MKKIGVSDKSATDKMISTDRELVDGILSCFMPLTEIPRQSHHEELISEYLYNWAKDRGLNPRKDSENNVIFDVPGTEGMEKAPLTILQGHMDMVIAVNEGKTFDRQKDRITVINDGDKITADGTSLGADDGMGIATALYIIENCNSHGPLRVIFTTDEEDGMTGAFNLTQEDVKGVKYVLNLDSEDSSNLTNSSASGIIGSFSMSLDTVNAENDAGYEIAVSGLQSGHSGLDIGKNRVNGIVALGKILVELQCRGVEYELSTINGGSFANAIPASAAACIAIKADDAEMLESELAGITDEIKKSCRDEEPGFEVVLKECESHEKVVSAVSKENILTFITSIQDGVYSMSVYVEGLVQSSSNLGLISLTADNAEFAATSLIRSSDPVEQEEMIGAQKRLAESCNIVPCMTLTADAWPVKPDSRLVEMVTDAYMKETGNKMNVRQIHAGLETGTFARLAPDLDMVSIGYDISNPHTVNEVCYLGTIPAAYRTIERVLATIGNEN